MKFLYHIYGLVKGLLSNKSAWFYSSEGNSLTECGPNCTAMAASWATGVRYSASVLRAMNPAPLYWNMPLIGVVLNRLDVPHHTVDPYHLNAPVTGIYHVGTNHLVFVVAEPGYNKQRLTVYDPLYSPYEADWNTFRNSISYPIAVIPTKLLPATARRR